MIGKLIGAAVGAELDRHLGQNGLRGAVTGVIIAGAMRRMGPMGLLIGGAWAAKQAYDRHQGDKARRGVPAAGPAAGPGAHPGAGDARA